MPTEIHAWLTDKDGYYVGEIDSPASNDDWPTFSYNAKQNGQLAIPKGKDPTATKPPMRPPSTEALAFNTKATRLQELRTKGWAILTVAEQAEAQALAFDLGR